MSKQPMPIRTTLKNLNLFVLTDIFGTLPEDAQEAIASAAVYLEGNYQL